ncbi:MAG: transcription antitermination factor NusB [Pseudomonadota bacterium]
MASHKSKQPRTAQPEGHATRRAALDLLLAVRRDRRMVSEVSDSIVEGLPPAERARAMRLADQTMRHGQRLKALLDRHLSKAPPLRVRMILQMAAGELCLDGAAAHGVVNGAVALTRSHRKTAPMAGLTNAVLRKVSAEAADVWPTLRPGRLPMTLRKPFVAAHGRAAVEAMERVFADVPPIDLTPKAGNLADLADALGGDALPTGSVRLHSHGRVSGLPGYDAGEWWVQDTAASIPARILDVKPGERVLDLCAAPGGKTLQLAAAGASVTALDISEPRLARLRENLTRCGLAAEVIAADALHFTPERPFDAILLDAPCSATGTIRRHPDLPWVNDLRNLNDLVSLQAQLLAKAMGWLRPGGRLVYATCSLLPAEGETQIDNHLARFENVKAVALNPVEFGLPPEATAPPGLRLRPDLWANRGGMDGFYIAKLIRG